MAMMIFIDGQVVQQYDSESDGDDFVDDKKSKSQPAKQQKAQKSQLSRMFNGKMATKKESEDEAPKIKQESKSDDEHTFSQK